MEDINALDLECKEDLLNAVLKYLGPNAFKKDASLVACSEPVELEYIRKNFLIGKLGRDKNDPNLDKAIRETCRIMGESNYHKRRPVFYYILMTIFEEDKGNLK